MFHLRNLKHIRSYFTKSSFKTVIQAFITSRVDYCNSLYSGLPDNTLRPLETAHHFAARILLQRSKFCRIKPVLKELHWLPVRSRIEFKVLLFTYKALNNLAPSYLTSLLSYKSHPRNLRSSKSKTLSRPKSLKIKMGDRAFSVFAPTKWNELPEEIKNAPTLAIFKKRLKTHLFISHFGPN